MTNVIGADRWELRDVALGDIMSTPVVTLEADLSLFLADWLMQARNIRHVPVIDAERRLCGLVTHRTILAAKHRQEPGSPLPVSEIMRPNPIALGASDSAADAARFMVENKIGCAVIVDDDNRIDGIVTESDFLGLATQVLFRSPRIAVDDFMTTNVVTLKEAEPLRVADELMRAGRFRHLPVVDRFNRLTGLVTHRDLLVHRSEGERVTAGDIATRDVWTIQSGSSARNAAGMLADHKFGCLPVIDNGKLVGLITEADVVSLIVRLLARQGGFGNARLSLRTRMSSPVQCTGVDTPLEVAKARMSHAGISCLGVVSDTNSIVGIATISDLIGPGIGDGSEVVGDRMTRDVVRVDIGASVAQAAQLIVEQEIHRVFVVEEARLVGVFSTSDATAAVRDEKIHTPLSEIMSPIVMTIDAGERLESGAEFLETARLHGLIVVDRGWPIGVLTQREVLLGKRGDNVVVDETMSGALLCLSSKLPAFRAAAQMVELGVGHVVAMDEGRAVGVVTGSDMAKLCARLDEGEAGKSIASTA